MQRHKPRSFRSPAIIVKDDISWLDVVLRVRHATLERIWRKILFVLAVAAAATIYHELYPDRLLLLTPAPFTLLGLAIGIFLGFRNNAGYDRYWEGRKQWGALVNQANSMTRQVLTLIHARDDSAPENEAVSEVRRTLILRIIAFVHALRQRLRDEEDVRSLAELLPPDELAALRTETNKPAAILHFCGDAIQEAQRQGWLHPVQRLTLESSLERLTDVLGACDRIKNTPIPFAYSLLLHRTVGLYCTLLPLGLVDSLGRWTPPMVVVVAYTFFGLDDIADELAKPFGKTHSALPLMAISRQIEISLRQRLYERSLPAPLTPKDGVLL